VNKVFSTVAYEKPGSKELIEACKIGDMQKLKKIFKNYPKYIVYDFDNVKLEKKLFLRRLGVSDSSSFCSEKRIL